MSVLVPSGRVAAFALLLVVGCSPARDPTSSTSPKLERRTTRTRPRRAGAVDSPVIVAPLPAEEVEPPDTSARDAERATKAASGIPILDAICLDDRAGGTCNFLMPEPPYLVCPERTTVEPGSEGCWWRVSLARGHFQSNGSMVWTGIATFFVEPGNFAVVAVREAECPDELFELDAFLAMKARRGKRLRDDCAGALPAPAP